MYTRSSSREEFFLLMVEWRLADDFKKRSSPPLEFPDQFWVDDHCSSYWKPGMNSWFLVAAWTSHLIPYTPCQLFSKLQAADKDLNAPLVWSFSFVEVNWQTWGGGGRRGGGGDTGATVTQCSSGKAHSAATEAVMNLIGVSDQCWLSAAC